MLPMSAAKSLRQLWIDIPDSIIPYLNKSLRTEFIDFVDMEVQADVKNLLMGDSKLDTLTTDYTQITLNESTVLQLKLLPYAWGDSIICFVKTFNAPEKESEVRFYDQKWNQLSTSNFIQKLESSSFIQKPDTMQADSFEVLKEKIEPEMLWAQLDQNDNSITYHMSTPLVSNDEKKALEAILVQRKFKWDGKMFK